MKLTDSGGFQKGSEVLLVVFFASLLLSLGIDRDGVLFSRGLFFLASAAWIFYPVVSRQISFPEIPKSAGIFLLLSAFVCLRFLIAALFHFLNIKNNLFDAGPAIYLRGAVTWLWYGAVLFAAYFIFSSKRKVIMLFWSGVGCGVFMAFNVIPNLLRKGSDVYQLADGTKYFFHPLFFKMSFVGEYLLGYFGHLNVTGDLIAVSFFMALSLLVYRIFTAEDKNFYRTKDEILKGRLSLAVLFVFLGLLLVAAVMFNSRGTNLFFVLAFLVFFVLLFLRMRKSSKKRAVLGAALVLFVFFAWGGNFGKIVKELGTLHDEVLRPSSATVNQQGAQKALAIFKDFPLFGAGTGQYEKISYRYQVQEKESPVVRRSSMCHYLHVLAEEGMGGVLYLIFVGMFFYDAFSGLKKARSRFQFLSGLGLMASVFLIQGHAAIGFIMENKVVCLLVFFLMGANLAVLRKDFKASEAI